MYGCKGNSMVELKPLISRLNRLAKCQGNQFSTEAQQKHMRNVVLFFFQNVD